MFSYQRSCKKKSTDNDFFHFYYIYTRKRLKWTQNLTITNLGSFKARVNHSERKIKKHRNNIGNHEINDDQPLDRFGTSGHETCNEYNHIQFPKAAMVDFCSDEYSTIKDQNLLHNRH